MNSLKIYNITIDIYQKFVKYIKGNYSMKKLILFIIFTMVCQVSAFAYSFSEASSQYSEVARTRAKYIPQGQFVNRYRRQQNNRIYSPQQARYYGYRVPQQNYYNNPYYNRYYRR
ncbi:hypothetical protein J6O48_10485 [bacterium]|nr:hypothetical protein [bacterium]